jgi:dTDP-4-amino-4,6-dideoxygalactose transaminase
MTTASRNIPFGRPWITDDDRQAVMNVLRGHILTHGPVGTAFEDEFAAFLGDDAHCVSISSGMAALHLAYLHFGIGAGDEVIVPALTHVATAHAVEWVGARPVFVDCDPATGNVTATHIAAAITPRTKAISVVHFVGIPCTMPDIVAVAERHGLKVIEDCAIAVGARYQGKHVGLFGDAACFSFYPVKHITTGEGGMFVTRHRDVAESVGKLRAFGVDRTHGERAIPGMYEVPTLGLNYRMSEMQAALGQSQLRRIEENLRMRRENFAALKRALTDLPNVRILDNVRPDAISSHYCLSLVLQDGLAARRDDIVAHLNAAGIGTSIYYPQPVPRMRYYCQKYGYDTSRFTHAADISDHSIALPVGPHVNADDVAYMADKLSDILREMQP